MGSDQYLALNNIHQVLYIRHFSASSDTGPPVSSLPFSFSEAGGETGEAEPVENKFTSPKISPFFRKAELADETELDLWGRQVRVDVELAGRTVNINDPRRTKGRDS
jgi:hypothetical protein